MKAQYDLGNLLCTWERSLEVLGISVGKIIKHIENDRPDSAGIRAKKTLKAIEAMQDQIQQTKVHLCGSYHNGVEKKL